MLKMLKLLLVLVLTGYGLACIYLWFRQPKFIFFTSAFMADKPTSVGLNYEDVWLNFTTGERLHGWWIPARSPQPKVLLYFHGNGNNIGANLGYAQIFTELGFNVFLVDYRGYGLSTGNFPTEESVYEDGEVVWNYLVKEKGFQPEQIFVYGHSLGGAIAIELALHHPQMAGLMVEGSFTSMGEMVSLHYPYFHIFPVDFLLHQRFDSLKKVPHLKMPILFIHGTADQLIPPSMSEELFNAAQEPKQLKMIEGAGHNDLILVGERQFIQTVKQFLLEVNQQKNRPF